MPPPIDGTLHQSCGASGCRDRLREHRFVRERDGRIARSMQRHQRHIDLSGRCVVALVVRQRGSLSAIEALDAGVQKPTQIGICRGIGRHVDLIDGCFVVERHLPVDTLDEVGGVSHEESDHVERGVSQFGLGDERQPGRGRPLERGRRIRAERAVHAEEQRVRAADVEGREILRAGRHIERRAGSTFESSSRT